MLQATPAFHDSVCSNCLQHTHNKLFLYHSNNDTYSLQYQWQQHGLSPDLQFNVPNRVT